MRSMRVAFPIFSRHEDVTDTRYVIIRRVCRLAATLDRRELPSELHAGAVS